MLRAMQNMAAATAIMDGSAMNFAAATVAMTSGQGGSGGEAARPGGGAARGIGRLRRGRGVYRPGGRRG